MRKWRAAFLALMILAVPCAAEVEFEQRDGQIDIRIDGKPFSTFYFGPRTPKPYLHPLRAANGAIVTRRYPMEEVEGENRDHPHHRGLWFTHGDVNGFDFWANEPSQKPSSRKGRIVLNRVVAVEDGLKQQLAGKVTVPAGRIQAVFDWRSPGGEELLTEERTMVFYSGGRNRILDFDITLSAGSEPVTFGDTKEGTFAIRMATLLEEPHAWARGPQRTGKIVSAEGRVGEPRNWGKRSPWVDYSGRIDGENVGIAIFDHPGNPRHPTYWHVRSYGLFAANIFGEHDFFADPSRNASLTVAPGESLRFRYRVVIHLGDLEEAGVAGLYGEYVDVSREP